MFIENVNALASSLTELLEIVTSKTQLLQLQAKLTELNEIHTNLDKIDTSVTMKPNIDALAAFKDEMQSIFDNLNNLNSAVANQQNINQAVSMQALMEDIINNMTAIQSAVTSATTSSQNAAATQIIKEATQLLKDETQTLRNQAEEFKNQTENLAGGNINANSVLFTDTNNLEAWKTSIEALLSSDDTTLDELQEVVTYIKNINNDLETITYDVIGESATIKHFTSTLKDKLDALDNMVTLQSKLNGLVSKTGTQTVESDIEFTGNIILSGSITDKTDIYSLGKVGEIGFGVATALPAWYSAIGATPLDGHDVKTSPNYGNYMHIASGAILVCIPKHYYRIEGNDFLYSDTPQAGYVIDRSFLNGDGIGGTVELHCVFIAKYGLTKNGTMASAQKGQDPLSTNSAHNPISALNGTPSNTYGGLYAAVKTMDTNAFSTPIFHYMMLAHMAQAHGKASSNTNVCAYIDVNPKMPKGNLNNALSDVNDTSVTFTSSGYSNCALTGSGVPFAKTTHNGQACGVADLNGNMWEVASAFIRTNANGFMVLKDTVDIRTITDDGTGATGAYNPALYDVIDISATVASQNAWTYYGNGTNQVFGFSTDTSSATYKQTAIGIPLAAGVSATGTTEFGNDGLYRASIDQMAALLGGDWNDISNAGVCCMILNNARTNSSNNVGGRASFLVQ